MSSEFLVISISVRNYAKWPNPAVSSLLNEHDLTKRNRWLTAGFELKQSFAQIFSPGFLRLSEHNLPPREPLASRAGLFI